MTGKTPKHVLQINQALEEQSARKNAEKWGYEFIDLLNFPINPDVLGYASRREVEEAEALPFFQTGKILRIAAIDPHNTSTGKLVHKLEKKGFEVEFFVCAKTGFEKTLEQYGRSFFTKKKVEVQHDFGVLEDGDEGNTSFEILAESIKGVPTETMLSQIKGVAVSLGVSDIHFQPLEKGLRLRFRIDGVLHDVLTLDADEADQVRNRIKYESNMRSNITDLPQDGHSQFRVNDRMVDFRVSTLPTPKKESIVLRILDPVKGTKSFSELGFDDRIERVIHQALDTKSGMTLVTGPTGSGKTTTLYAMLTELNTPERKLVTLEDPIEYQIDGVSQSEISDTKQYTFEKGFQSLLRHDPDVMLVGEIRNRETAKLAAEASLTGHIVLSSLHTNSAVGSLTRLQNLGLENFNIAPSVRAIFAQRLVRRVCPHCATKVSLPKNKKVDEALKRLKKLLPGRDIPTELPKAQGCESCAHIGYKGQVALTEAFLIDEDIEKMILEGKTELDVLRYLREEKDYLNIWEDGILKVLDGVTTLEEVARVVE